MTFRGNFIIEVVTRVFWFGAQLVLFDIIYSHVDAIRDWTRYEYFAFMATAMLINAIVEALFMPNFANFSELIRTGNLDFALLKPIDTQFLVSFERVNLAMVKILSLALGLDESQSGWVLAGLFFLTVAYTLLAGLLGCPLFLMLAVRGDDGCYRAYAEVLSERVVFERAERDKVVRELAAAYAGRLEHYILKAPYQWFNFFDYWNDGG